MNHNIVLDKIKDTACLLYQNKEKEGIEAVAELLQLFQQLLQSLTEKQMNSCGNFAILMLRELLESYQRQDVLGMADCLMEKSMLFVQYISK